MKVLKCSAICVALFGAIAANATNTIGVNPVIEDKFNKTRVEASRANSIQAAFLNYFSRNTDVWPTTWDELKQFYPSGQPTSVFGTKWAFNQVNNSIILSLDTQDVKFANFLAKVIIAQSDVTGTTVNITINPPAEMAINDTFLSRKSDTNRPDNNLMDQDLRLGNYDITGVNNIVGEAANFNDVTSNTANINNAVFISTETQIANIDNAKIGILEFDNAKGFNAEIDNITSKIILTEEFSSITANIESLMVSGLSTFNEVVVSNDLTVDGVLNSDLIYSSEIVADNVNLADSLKSKKVETESLDFDTATGKSITVDEITTVDLIAENLVVDVSNSSMVNTNEIRINQSVALTAEHDYLKINNNDGFVNIGADSNSAVFLTDKSKFEFNKSINVDGNISLDGTVNVGSNTYIADGQIVIEKDGNPSLDIRSKNGGTPLLNFSNDATSNYDMRFVLTNNDKLEVQGGNLSGDITAKKLATARTISLSGALTGSTTFDGSSNADIRTTLNISGISRSDSNQAFYINQTGSGKIIDYQYKGNSKSYITNAGTYVVLNGTTSTHVAYNGITFKNSNKIGALNINSSDQIVIDGAGLYVGSGETEFKSTVNFTNKANELYFNLSTSNDANMISLQELWAEIEQSNEFGDDSNGSWSELAGGKVIAWGEKYSSTESRQSFLLPYSFSGECQITITPKHWFPHEIIACSNGSFTIDRWNSTDPSSFTFTAIGKSKEQNGSGGSTGGGIGGGPGSGNTCEYQGKDYICQEP